MSTVHPEGFDIIFEEGKGWKKKILGNWYTNILTIFALLFFAAFIVFLVLYLKERDSYKETIVKSDYCDLQICKRSYSLPPLVIISMDGFRASYLSLNISPAIQRIIDCGTHSKFMIPVFPSKTFPNHYSIATGLYPESHGIVDNEFRDPNHPEQNFSQKSKAEGWYLGDPIWNTVQAFDLRSAVYFWPGSEAPVNGKKATITTPYDASVPYSQRIDKAIEWLLMDEKQRPSLIMFYMENPDAAGHQGGPYSELVRNAIITVDGMINYFTRRLLEEKIFGCVNIILLSDHGMQLLDYNRTLIIENEIPNFDEYLFTGVVARIAGKNNESKIDDIINPLQCKHGQDYIVHKRHRIPARFHYDRNDRIGDVVIRGKVDVPIVRSFDEKKNWMKYTKGDHGFDNRLPEMRAIFAAIGPSIKVSQEIPEFENIELYNLFADLLSIKSSPNNGTKGRLYDVLRFAPSINESQVSNGDKLCVSSVTIKMCSPTCQPIDKIVDCKGKLKKMVKLERWNENDCSISLCEGIMHYNLNTKKVRAIEVSFSKQDWMRAPRRECINYIEGIDHSCKERFDNRTISLFMQKDSYNTLEPAFVDVVNGFTSNTWNYLEKKVGEYIDKYGNISAIIGPVYDSNFDGIMDDDKDIMKSNPSHIFAVIFKCKNGESDCKDLSSVSYVLPIIEKDFNCLSEEEYLFQNTVRIRDIEYLTGIKLFADRSVWSAKESLMMNTRIIQNLEL